MSTSIPAPKAQPGQQEWRAEARRSIRRKRILYTLLGSYAVLSFMWFFIDMADGTESLWFYWPMFGTGSVVAVISVAFLGMGGLLGADWERQQIERFRHLHDGAE